MVDLRRSSDTSLQSLGSVLLGNLFLLPGKPVSTSFLKLNFIFLKDFIYLFMRDREAETQAEGEAAPLQGAGCGTGFLDPRITPRAEGSGSTAEPPGCPKTYLF